MFEKLQSVDVLMVKTISTSKIDFVLFYHFVLDRLNMEGRAAKKSDGVENFKKLDRLSLWSATKNPTTNFLKFIRFKGNFIH